MSIRLYIGILSLLIFWSRIRRINWLILDLPSIIKRVLKRHRYINLWWGVRCTCVLRFWMEVRIQPRVMCGLWESSSIRCYMARPLIRLVVLRNLFRKLTRNRSDTLSNLRLQVCNSFWNRCWSINPRKEFHGRKYLILSCFRSRKRLKISHQAWVWLKKDQKTSWICLPKWTPFIFRTKKSSNRSSWPTKTTETSQ